MDKKEMFKTNFTSSHPLNSSRRHSPSVPKKILKLYLKKVNYEHGGPQEFFKGKGVAPGVGQEPLKITKGHYKPP